MRFKSFLTIETMALVLIVFLHNLSNAIINAGSLRTATYELSISNAFSIELCLPVILVLWSFSPLSGVSWRLKC
ncbi:MAG: hypothetical protein HY279_14120 [Nitrospinae bacterium]|nr:hypothetical protein [Nitrospinota bacterium]